LPTLFEWDKAARNGNANGMGVTYPWATLPEASDVTQRANFRDTGPLPVDSLPAGMSAYGAQNMAGNVKEWMRNALDDGFAATGGAWDEPAYQFGRSGSYPAFFSGPTLGFRCVRETAPQNDQGSFALATDREVPVFKPVDDAAFAKILKRYEYPPEPLDAKVVEVVQTDDWTREKITYRGAHGKTALAYLYLPKGFRPPLQVVHFIPAGDVANGMRPLAPSAEINLGPEIRSGRAVFCVALTGYLDRPRPADDTRDDVEEIIDGVTDLRRGLDYLLTRKEIDGSRIGVYGPSAGSVHGMIVTAVDHRYRSVVFMGVGVTRQGASLPPEINRVIFAPRITAPKLLIHGKYDEADVLRTMAEPVYRIMREPKKVQLYESGHVVPLELLLPAMHGFFDETMGKV
jgi:dienelactone hydrolase